MTRVDIPLGDEFSDSAGEFTDYDVIPTDQRAQIHKQKHVDVRSFVSEAIDIPVTMLHLDRLTLDDLSTTAVGQIDFEAGGRVIFRPAEPWSNGEVARQADRNHWNGLTLTCPTGQTTTSQSIITNP